MVGRNPYFEIHVLGHAPNDFVRPRKRGAAAEDEGERCRVDCR
jgi:hypothetical protein